MTPEQFAYWMQGFVELYLIFHYWDWLVWKWAEAHGIDTSDWED